MKKGNQRSVFILLLTLLAVALLILPFLVTFNEFLTRLFEHFRFYGWLEKLMTPLFSKMVVVLVRPLGINIIAFSGGVVANDIPLRLSWNCLGWQSFLLLCLTLLSGLTGNFTLGSKIEAIVLGILGTFFVNLLRITSTVILAVYSSQVFAIVYHNYASALISLSWLIFFWWFVYAYVLREEHPLTAPPDYFEPQNLNFFQRTWHQKKLQVVLKLLKGLKFQKGLDVGCAAGTLTERIRRATRKKKFWGIDLDVQAIKLGKKKYPRLVLRSADALKLPFASQSFDLIVCLDTLEHLQNPVAFLKQARRLLKKNGYLLVDLALETRLFKLIWWLWKKTKGRVWQNVHVQHYVSPLPIITLAQKLGFKPCETKKSHLGMNIVLKFQK